MLAFRASIIFICSAESLVGNIDNDLHKHVTAPVATHIWKAFGFQSKYLVGLGSRGNVQ